MFSLARRCGFLKSLISSFKLCEATNGKYAWRLYETAMLTICLQPPGFFSQGKQFNMAAIRLIETVRAVKFDLNFARLIFVL